MFTGWAHEWAVVPRCGPVVPGREPAAGAPVVSLAALLVPLAACSDGGGQGSEETPEEVLAAAKVALTRPAA